MQILIPAYQLWIPAVPLFMGKHSITSHRSLAGRAVQAWAGYPPVDPSGWGTLRSNGQVSRVTAVDLVELVLLEKADRSCLPNGLREELLAIDGVDVLFDQIFKRLWEHLKEKKTLTNVSLLNELFRISILGLLLEISMVRSLRQLKDAELLQMLARHFEGNNFLSFSLKRLEADLNPKLLIKVGKSSSDPVIPDISPVVITRKRHKSSSHVRQLKALKTKAVPLQKMKSSSASDVPELPPKDDDELTFLEALRLEPEKSRPAPMLKNVGKSSSTPTMHQQKVKQPDSPNSARKVHFETKVESRKSDDKSHRLGKKKK